jgi:hypothetical protein
VASKLLPPISAGLGAILFFGHGGTLFSVPFLSYPHHDISSPGQSAHP